MRKTSKQKKSADQVARSIEKGSLYMLSAAPFRKCSSKVKLKLWLDFPFGRNELSIFVKFNILGKAHLHNPQHFCKIAIVLIYSLFYSLKAFANFCSSKLFS